MKDLLRRTVAILRSHPILWVPYVVTELIAGGINWLRHLADRQILRWVALRRVESVFGGNVGPRGVDSASMQTVLRLRTSLAWGTHYIADCLFALALVLTAMMVGVILRGEGPALATAAAKLRGYPMRIFIYAAKVWFLSLILYIVLLWPTYVSESVLHLSGLGLYAFSAGLALLDSLCIAWILAPIAINLLRPVGSPAITSQEKKRARYVYLVIAVAANVIARFVGGLLLKLNFGAAVTSAALHFSALLSNLPFIFLYISFALIADAELRERTAPGNSKFRELLRTLMPLHFQRRRES